eukprot:scaffold2033_cov164-Amphora_coffeaeformis.AAC.7
MVMMCTIYGTIRYCTMSVLQEFLGFHLVAHLPRHRFFCVLFSLPLADADERRKTASNNPIRFDCNGPHIKNQK